MSSKTPRLNLVTAAPVLLKEYQKAMIALAASASLEPGLSELVQIRVSQINGCAHCLNLHFAEAREKGESEQRLFLVAAWRDAPCYSERERAALGWAEVLARLSEGADPEQAYTALKAHFSEEEQVKLSVIVNIIGGWNRLAVGFGVFAEAAEVRASARAAAA
ncbi:carboxymuconolactone decarboxylase family protein [Dyella sp. 2RAB6]|uniref:carboxymuconolactone decarboxylase family protein n=1 Tax=Dyella sp. 2RAB6 TaxID=3232992 RepID=UPI003F8EFF04